MSHNINVHVPPKPEHITAAPKTGVKHPAKKTPVEVTKKTVAKKTAVPPKKKVVKPVKKENVYNIDDIKIEFMKDFHREYNEFLPNKTYDFYPIENTHGAFPKVEFDRKDPIAYIKLKGKDLWLYINNNGPYFDLVPFEDFTFKQPFVVWFEYPIENEVLVCRYLGYGLDSTIKTIYDKVTNIRYLDYKEVGDKIYINWVENVADATTFNFNKIVWVDTDPDNAYIKPKVKPKPKK